MPLTEDRRNWCLDVWTGTNMMIWIGAFAARPIVEGIYNEYNDGAAYDPVGKYMDANLVCRRTCIYD